MSAMLVLFSITLLHGDRVFDRDAGIVRERIPKLQWPNELNGNAWVEDYIVHVFILPRYDPFFLFMKINNYTLVRRS